MCGKKDELVNVGGFVGVREGDDLYEQAHQRGILFEGVFDVWWNGRPRPRNWRSEYARQSRNSSIESRASIRSPNSVHCYRKSVFRFVPRPAATRSTPMPASSFRKFRARNSLDRHSSVRFTARRRASGRTRRIRLPRRGPTPTHPALSPATYPLSRPPRTRRRDVRGARRTPRGAIGVRNRR